VIYEVISLFEYNLFQEKCMLRTGPSVSILIDFIFLVSEASLNVSCVFLKNVFQYEISEPCKEFFSVTPTSEVCKVVIFVLLSLRKYLTRKS
jgi:hypothetical protein